MMKNYDMQISNSIKHVMFHIMIKVYETANIVDKNADTRKERC